MNHNAFCDNNFDAKFTKIGNLQYFFMNCLLMSLLILFLFHLLMQCHCSLNKQLNENKKHAHKLYQTNLYLVFLGFFFIYN